VIQIVILLLVALLVYLALGEDTTRETERIARRRFQNWWARYGRYITRPVVLPTAVLLALALLMRDVVLTPFLLIVAAAVAYFRIQRIMVELNTITPRQVSQLVLAFRGAYQIQPAVFKSLGSAAEKVGEPLRELLNVTVETFFTTSSPARAFDVFRGRTDNPSLRQFIYILEMSESATNESVVESLDLLVRRLRVQEELQRQVESSMASITGQTSFMQVLAVIIAFMVALIPGFRQIYASGLLGRAGYILLIAIILGGSYLIEKKTQQLREQIL
jgi:hypothetical protein